MIVNKNQLADVLGVSERTLTEWQDQGMPIELVGGRGHENQYNTAKVIEWRIQKALAGENQRSAKDQKELFEGRLLELELAEKAGLLVSVDDVGPLWEGSVLAARTDLLGMGPRIKATIDARYAIDVDITMIEDEIHHALTKLSERPPAIDVEDDEQGEVVDVEEAGV